MKPLIALSPDEGFSPDTPGRPSLPRYELKMAYVQAVLDAGGVPLMLPYAVSEIARYVELCDGFVVTGGAFDVSPEEYGEAPRVGLGPLKAVRTGFERRLIEEVLRAGKPLLGICGGMQLLNVVLGGSLVQHIPDEIPDALPHEQPFDPRQPAHDVSVIPGSRLHGIAGADVIAANTTHHQAVGRLGRGLVASGCTADGVIEAIEHASDFVLGVQWHPELLDDAVRLRLYGALVEACAR